MNQKLQQKVTVELQAVVVSVANQAPLVMVTPDISLPSGPLGTEHRTLQQALRAWVEEQSGLKLGYIEQLYTFADIDRTTVGGRYVSIGYLALTRAALYEAKRWYDFFPWEDHRKGVPQPVTSLIMQGLDHWRKEAPDAMTRRAREEQININFPKDPRKWNEELVLQRYEMLWEAGLIEEAKRGAAKKKGENLGEQMPHDHRRILATGMARLRAKIKYRPVVFELMPDRFTLLQLQGTVEALAGLRLHKQNFRRLVQGQGLVEETGDYLSDNRGRPAKLFAFRREVLRERAAAGTKLPRSG